MSEIHVTKDGPYLVSGNLPLAKVGIGANADGESVHWEWGDEYPQQQQYALCRCGRSASKPYCDGTHANIGFDGAETADRQTYREQAKLFAGPAMSLTDVTSLCAGARFCDPNGKVWTLVTETDQAEARRNFVRETCDCPSGRLVASDNVEDCSGPLWVRGGVAVIGTDGYRYEVRNRVTLCRCGASKNKPFCDGSHIAAKFRDGL